MGKNSVPKKCAAEKHRLIIADCGKRDGGLEGLRPDPRQTKLGGRGDGSPLQKFVDNRKELMPYLLCAEYRKKQSQMLS